MEATLQGEIHRYDDFDSALDEPLSSYDALLVEGRDDDGILMNLSTGYTLFLMGYILIMQINSGEDLEPAAREAGLGYHDDIDADVRTIYHEMSSPLIRGAAFVFLTVALFCLLLLALLLTEVLSLSGFAPILAVFVVSLLAIFIVPLTFTSLIAVVSTGCLCGGLRDEHMADRVDSLAEEYEYERVLVRCGQSHVPGIAEELEEEGWDVDRRRSQSLLGRTLRLLGKPFNLVCRAIGLLVVRIPGGKPPYLKNNE